MNPLRCSHCSDQNETVYATTQYVGGFGYLPVNLCADAQACWGRWWAANHGELLVDKAA